VTIDPRKVRVTALPFKK